MNYDLIFFPKLLNDWLLKYTNGPANRATIPFETARRFFRIVDLDE